jgi:hypothetical protein
MTYRRGDRKMLNLSLAIGTLSSPQPAGRMTGLPRAGPAGACTGLGD